MFSLAYASLKARWLPVLLVLISLTASMVLLLSIDRIQNATKQGFNQSISGVDLLVGPRSGDIELVLYSVFHIGQPTNNLTYRSIKHLQQLPEVDWVVPLALGDSHEGYRVIATTPEYFDKVKYALDRSLSFAAGEKFSRINEVVLGYTVASELGYQIGSELYLAHGSGGKLGRIHDDYSFVVSGILEPTGTPSDQALFVSLQGYELIHKGWESGRKLFGVEQLDKALLNVDQLTPDTVTAAFVGLKSKMTLFKVSRSIAEYRGEALSAVIPGIALADLWSILGMVDRVFKFLGWIVIGISIIAMVTLTLSTLDARSREMAILRANGAPPGFVAGLVLVESLLIGLCAILVAIGLVSLATHYGKAYLTTELGIVPEVSWVSQQELLTFGVVLGAGLVSSLLPALMVYRRTLRTGLMG